MESVSVGSSLSHAVRSEAQGAVQGAVQHPVQEREERMIVAVSEAVMTERSTLASSCKPLFSSVGRVFRYQKSAGEFYVALKGHGPTQFYNASLQVLGATMSLFDPSTARFFPSLRLVSDGSSSGDVSFDAVTLRGALALFEGVVLHTNQTGRLPLPKDVAGFPAEDKSQRAFLTQFSRLALQTAERLKLLATLARLRKHCERLVEALPTAEYKRAAKNILLVVGAKYAEAVGAIEACGSATSPPAAVPVPAAVVGSIEEEEEEDEEEEEEEEEYKDIENDPDAVASPPPRAPRDPLLDDSDDESQEEENAIVAASVAPVPVQQKQQRPGYVPVPAAPPGYIRTTAGLVKLPVAADATGRIAKNDVFASRLAPVGVPLQERTRDEEHTLMRNLKVLSARAVEQHEWERRVRDAEQKSYKEGMEAAAKRYEATMARANATLENERRQQQQQLTAERSTWRQCEQGLKRRLDELQETMGRDATERAALRQRLAELEQQLKEYRAIALENARNEIELGHLRTRCRELLEQQRRVEQELRESEQWRQQYGPEMAVLNTQTQQLAETCKRLAMASIVPMMARGSAHGSRECGLVAVPSPPAAVPDATTPEEKQAHQSYLATRMQQQQPQQLMQQLPQEFQFECHGGDEYMVLHDEDMLAVANT